MAILVAAVLLVALGGRALAAEPPTVTKVEPVIGLTEGGNLVTITGTNFTGATAVMFGSTSASPFAVNSPTSLNAVSPPGAAGTVDVTVTTPAGTSATTAADQFHYNTPFECPQNPAITRVEPVAGPTGTSVKIFGERFRVFCGDVLFTAQQVIFGAEKATVTGFSTEPLNVVSPSGSGTVDVRVAFNGEGQKTSPITAADRFTFLPNAPIVETKAASSITPSTATLNASVNPNGKEVSECKLEYGTTTSYGSSAPCTPPPGSGESPVAVSASATGLSPRTTYHHRISATNAAGTSVSFDETFKTLPPPPTVVTTAASSVNQTQATLHGSVNPNGSEVGKCEFEYGETTAYGKSAPCTPSPGSGESSVAVSAQVTGLASNTTYHFRLSATNPGGASAGGDETFNTLANAGTPPTAATAAATSVTRSSATLNATVNPDGGGVYECKLEYGTTTSYGSSAPCTPSPGSGESPVAVSASVTGLTPNTTYHFRISATNPGGTSLGSDETLTTQPFIAPTVVIGAATSISQSSATLDATVNPDGGEVSECKFEYGTTTSYGKTASCSSLPGHGESPVSVSASTGLNLMNKTTYHFRISATNGGGTTVGPDATLTASSAHVYKNGVIGAQGKKVRTLGWGTLKLTNSTLGEVECHDVMAGYLENPTSGASAAGQTQAFVPYECVSAGCTALGGSAIEVSAEKLPWSDEVTEAEEGGFRIRSGNRLKAAAAAFERVNCVGKLNAQFSGEDAPKLLNNGLSIGAFPSEQEFDQPGSRELESEASGGLKFAGKLNVEGYASQELIEVKNP